MYSKPVFAYPRITVLTISLPLLNVLKVPTYLIVLNILNAYYVNNKIILYFVYCVKKNEAIF